MVGTALKHERRSLEFTHILEILNIGRAALPDVRAIVGSSWIKVLTRTSFLLFVCLFLFILKSLFISCKLTAFCNTFHNKNMLENLNIKPNGTLQMFGRWQPNTPCHATLVFSKVSFYQLKNSDMSYRDLFARKPVLVVSFSFGKPEMISTVFLL